MHVTIYGAGALGCVYGTHLAEAGVSVSFVTARPRDPACAVTLERVGTSGIPRHLYGIDWRLSAPATTDLILVTVAADVLADVARTLAAVGNAPVVILSPMLPPLYAEIREILGERLFGGLPTAIAYHSPGSSPLEEVYRYWLPPAPTKFDDGTGQAGTPSDALLGYQATLAEFVKLLVKSGVPAALGPHMADQAAAATLAMAPLMIALYVAGSVDALVADHTLRDLAARALQETDALVARALPKAALPGVGMTPPFVRSSLLGSVVGLTKLVSPETILHLNAHFAHGKLRGQHAAFILETSELAATHSLEMPALVALGERLSLRP
jgi:ketopantoate reductase